MARVLMVASEATPFAKTGGLADMVGSLPTALAAHGHEVAVVLPRYAGVDLKGVPRVYEHLDVWLGASRYDLTVYRVDAGGTFFLLDCPPLYGRIGLYGDASGDYPDNHLRFAALAKGALGVARQLFPPDILHCHDWQAGLVPAYLRSVFSADPAFLGVRTLFTIHNLGYQGLFPHAALPEVGLGEELFVPGGLEFFDQVSYIKAGIMFSDRLNTVSPTYAREIRTPEYGCGLDGALRVRADVLSGILNGVDYERWDPQTDRLIAARYSAGDLTGKRESKRALLREAGLPEADMDRPLAAIVSRLAPQKGMALVLEAAGRLVDAGLSLVVLGEGDADLEAGFRRLAAERPTRVAARIGFDDALAHRIEAGADLFLMPSLYEPCGLNQIYSLRYGTVPVVRATGGLDDTIEEDTGFKFQEFTAAALLRAVREALEAWADRPAWEARMRRGMVRDFSWPASAAAYSRLYSDLVER